MSNDEREAGTVGARPDDMPDEIALPRHVMWAELKRLRASLPSPAPPQDLLREIDKWCSGENQVDDGEDAEDALRYIQGAIRAFIAGEVALMSPEPAQSSAGVSTVGGSNHRTPDPDLYRPQERGISADSVGEAEPVSAKPEPLSAERFWEIWIKQRFPTYQEQADFFMLEFGWRRCAWEFAEAYAASQSLPSLAPQDGSGDKEPL